MKGNFHVQFLGGGEVARLPCYPAVSGWGWVASGTEPPQKVGRGLRRTAGGRGHHRLPMERGVWVPARDPVRPARAPGPDDPVAPRGGNPSRQERGDRGEDGRRPESPHDQSPGSAIRKTNYHATLVAPNPYEKGACTCMIASVGLTFGGTQIMSAWR
jgi:hypothetical protein